MVRTDSWESGFREMARLIGGNKGNLNPLEDEWGNGEGVHHCLARVSEMPHLHKEVLLDMTL